MDIIETAHEYHIEMDVPGIELDMIEVTAGPVRGTVRVVATVSEPRETAGQLLLAERRTRAAGVQTYTRTVPIGWDADLGNVKKTLRNGVLRIVIPRTAQSTRPETATK